jgi:acyl-CoA dehydrogenase
MIEEILKTVRQFVREDVVPLEAEIEERDDLPDGIRRALRELGLYGFSLPEEHGGLGLSMIDEARLVMELGYTTPALRSAVGTNNGIAGHTLMLAGTPEQQRDWLPRIAAGDVVASFALTEPEAGSDPSRLRTVARRVEGGWSLTGTKRFITNAPVADVFMVYARTDPDAPPARGISTFLVPAGSSGLTIGPRDHKMGQRGAWTADVYLDDLHVDDHALIGGQDGLNRGYLTALQCLAHGRVHIAALCVGMAERLVDEMVGYATTREQGGQVIGDYQLIQGLLADSVTEFRAARALVLDAARDYDSDADRRLAPAAAKYFASEAVGRIADRAVQVHGGSGYMNGVAVERFYRDARLFRIYEGTSQVQQTIIARQAMRSSR